jgi:NAD(P)-dependent dehydrogenase (short-subunit alcohol dehydrogenase family)
LSTAATDGASQSILVTGCSSGFGLLTAVAFARRGDHVFAGVRDSSAVDRLMSIMSEDKLPISLVSLDVTDSHSVDECVREVIGRASRIDVLVNNAGIATFAAVEDSDDEMAAAIMSTNFLGALRMTRAVLPYMRSEGSGRIIMVSSVNGIIGMPFSGVYSASKFALEALSEALSGEVGSLGIGVTIVQPGPFHTEIDKKLLMTVPSIAFPGVAGEIARMRNSMAADTPEDVAFAIVSAARAANAPTRVQVGADAERLYRARRQMDDQTLAANLLTVLTGG